MERNAAEGCPACSALPAELAAASAQQPAARPPAVQIRIRKGAAEVWAWPPSGASADKDSFSFSNGLSNIRVRVKRPEAPPPAEEEDWDELEGLDLAGPDFYPAAVDDIVTELIMQRVAARPPGQPLVFAPAVADSALIK